MSYNALVKIQMKRASSSDWKRSTNSGSAWKGYILREAEFGVEVFPDGSTKIKIGNGILTWEQLDYISGNAGKFLTTLPYASDSELETLYIVGDKIYYTKDQTNWIELGGGAKEFDELIGRPKYNGTPITSTTNIPKVPTKALELPYSNTSSGLTSANVQNAIDEVNIKIKGFLPKVANPSILYGTDNTGNQTSIKYSTTKLNNSVPVRTTIGTIKTSDPIQDDDASTKLYVDQADNLLRTSINTNTSNIANNASKINTNATNISNLTTNINNLSNDIITLDNKVQVNTTNITTLQGQIATLQADGSTAANDISLLKARVTNNETNINQLRTDLNTEATNRQNADIKSFTQTGTNKNTLVITKNDNSTMQVTIPIASVSQTGLITKEAYKQIQDSAQDIQDLKNVGGHYIGQSFATKAALDAFVITSDIKVGDFTFVKDDETHDDALTRYICTLVNGVKTFTFAYVIENDPIGIATLTKTGLVKSSSTAGQISVAVDGKMSLNGYDNIINTLVDKVDKVAGKGLSTNDLTNTMVNKINLIKSDGDGTKYLADNGSYKTLNTPVINVTGVEAAGISVLDENGIAQLHKVASSGSYNDLQNIPSNLVKDSNYVHTDNNFTNQYKSMVGILKNDGNGTKALMDDGRYKQLHTVAFTGSYNDLIDKPTGLVLDNNYVHTDNNLTDALLAKLNIINDGAQANILEGVMIDNVLLSIDTNKNVNIDLTAYAKTVDLPTKLSEFINDNNTVTDSNYVHTDNNFNDDLVIKLSGIEANAQVNKIEKIKVNGTALPITSADKSVNIDLTDYAKADNLGIIENNVTKNAIDIQALKVSGLWRGIFNTDSDIPTNMSQKASFIGKDLFLNDYIIVKQDSTHIGTDGNPLKTRYYVTAIDETTGIITWQLFDKTINEEFIATKDYVDDYVGDIQTILSTLSSPGGV